MMSKKSPDQSNSEMTFYDNYVPSLKAGEYKITVSQKLTKDGGSPSIPSAPQAPVTQRFQVRGPRFTLDPADVHRMFPPPNGTGVYDVYLPMLVLNKRALPWERELTLTVKDPTLYPWMALLVFSEDELLIPQPPSSTVSSPPSGSQKNPARSASFPLTDVVHATWNGVATKGPPPGILGPTLKLEADEDPNTIQVNVIDISVDTFSELIPTVDDLRFLAHVRQVSTENKEPQQATHDGWYSAVISNRFAIPPVKTSATKGYKNIVHLVSLEGLEKYLGTDPPVKPSGYQKVRFISLASWTFTCLPDPVENFRTLMLNLISKSSEQGTDLLLRMPLSDPGSATTDPQKDALTRLQDGFIPLSYVARTGEETFAWYRGPMTPVVMKPFLKEANPELPAHLTTPQNPSEAMVYDPSTGLFDQSYAVAFQTGRSLALASKPFATNLLQWRREAHTLIDRLQEYLRSPHLKGMLQRDTILDANGNLTNVNVTDLASLLKGNIVSDALKNFLATDFADSIAKRVGQGNGSIQSNGIQHQDSSTIRKPSVPSDLATLMQHPTVKALLRQRSGLEVTENDSSHVDNGAMPKQIIEWLAQTALLYNVPFNNVLPDERMLPDDSIRFFYIDQNWINSLLDGALSIGIQSSRDSLFNQLMRKSLHRAVDAAISQVRDKIRKVSSSATPSSSSPIAGFVLRSSVLSGWPGLEIQAWSKASGATPMKPLRLDRVSPSVMIALYPDVPTKLEFNEPSEGLVFGREDTGIVLRYLPGTTGETKANLGKIMTPEVKLTTAEIDAVKREPSNTNSVLKFGGTGGLVEALQNKFPAPQPTLTPASLAIQMVLVPEQMLFEPKNGGSK